MGFNSLTFESAPPDARKQHLLEAHKLLRSVIFHRNQVTPEINESGAMDLEATMRMEHLYSNFGVQVFAERWGPLFGASPQSPATLTPEAFLQALYPKDTRLLFGYGDHDEADDDFPFFREGNTPASSPQEGANDIFPGVVPNAAALEPGLRKFWPHPISPEHQDAISNAELANHSKLVIRWRYLWVPIGDHYEADWMYEQVTSGALRRAADCRR